MKNIGLIGLILVSMAGFANAALTYSDINVLTDGRMEYLAIDSIYRVTLPELEAMIAEGIAGHTDWRLGSRFEFFDMVQKHLDNPLANYGWNDLFLSDNTVMWMHDDVYANLHNPEMSLIRSGDANLARELKELALMMGGSNADPAFALSRLGTADLDGNGKRYLSSFGAYYRSDTGTSISRNNTVYGPGSRLTRSMDTEDTLPERWFVVREVPEPATMSLLAAGTLIMLRRKKR